MSILKKKDKIQPTIFKLDPRFVLDLTFPMLEKRLIEIINEQINTIEFVEKFKYENIENAISFKFLYKSHPQWLSFVESNIKKRLQTNFWKKTRFRNTKKSAVWAYFYF